MDPPDRRGLIVDRAQQPGGEVAVIDDFFLPFPPQPRLDRVGRPGDVLGIDVAADAKRVEMPKPALARTSQPVGQEVAIIMTKHDVGDDLRLGWLVLHLATRPEPVAVAHPRQQLSQTGVTKACPLVAGKQGIARNDQHLFARAHEMSLMGLSQSMAREPSRGDPCPRDVAWAAGWAAGLVVASPARQSPGWAAPPPHPLARSGRARRSRLRQAV